MTDDPYRRWDDRDAVARFAAKGVGDFFRTETRFLGGIAAGVRSVLDIGCASGRFLELLAAHGCRPAYTGVDVSAEQVASARALYPEASFHHGNALELAIDGPFDLVNATGVMQHEPRHTELVGRMVAWSSRWVLFDVKLAPLGEDIVDIGRSYAGTPEHRLFFNVLSARRLLERLGSLDGVAHASVYGYATPPNASTIVPPEVALLVSAGVLLERGPGPLRLDIDLPEELL